VHEEVEQARRRSGWPAHRTLAALGVSRRSYYRWRQAARWREPAQGPPAKPVSPYAALADEKQAVVTYALKHPAVRHRELAWRMVDEEVACVSPSTVYRILREAGLVCPWRRRQKRSRAESERAQRADQRWGTDLMYLQVLDRHYYYIGFLDEYSRYLVHHELLRSLDGASVAEAAQRALETLPRGEGGELVKKPEVRSDNGSGYLSGEFRQVLVGQGLNHVKIRPHCPEENGLMERSNRTVREAWEEEEEPRDVQMAERQLAKVVHWYNHERLHSALGYLRPVDYYRGAPEELHAARRVKLAQARHRRREINLGRRQQSLPLAT
jgi:putative transposase